MFWESIRKCGAETQTRRREKAVMQGEGLVPYIIGRKKLVRSWWAEIGKVDRSIDRVTRR